MTLENCGSWPEIKSLATPKLVPIFMRFGCYKTLDMLVINIILSSV